MVKELLIHKGDTTTELIQTVREFVNRYPNGVVVRIEPYCLPRTKKQNGTYQVMVRRLSEQSGYPTPLIKEMAKQIAVGHGYPVERDDEGEPVLKYGSLVPKSTKDVTIGQMKILIEALHELALKYDIVLEDVKG